MSSDKPVKYEKYNATKLNYVIGLGALQFADKQIHKDLIAYRRRADKKRGTVMVVYDNKSGGRYFPQNGRSLQGMPGNVRNFIANDFYCDVDIVNAQPTILSQFCKSKGWPCKYLKRYVKKREEILEQVQEEIGCERAVAKEAVVSLMMGEYCIYKTGFLANFSSECLEIHRLLCEDVDYKELFETRKKDKHIIAEAKGNKDAIVSAARRSTFALTLQDVEHTILREIDIALAGLGLSMDVYIHDGGLVTLHPDGTPVTEEEMQEVEGHVLETTGYEIKLAVKHMETTYKIDDMGDKKTEEEVVGCFYKIADFQDMKEKFEESNFFVKDLVCMCNIHPDGSHRCYSMKDAGYVYEAEWRLPARKSSGEPTTLRFFDVWRECPTRKAYTKLVFKDPAKTEPDEFSIFHGFRASLLKTKGVEASAAGLAKWLELVANLSNGDAAVYDHIIKYMAHTIQKPFVRSDVSLINSGPKGVGKDLCWNTLGYGVIGPDLFQNITDIEKQLLNTHETSLEGKVLIKLEEANEHIMLKYKNYIKSLVTQTYARINKKNITPYNIETYYRIVMTSNYVCPASLEDGERRFALYPVGALHKGDNAYWEEAATLLAEDTTAVAIYDYLMGIDLTGFNPRNYVETEVAKAIIITEFKSEDGFLLEFATHKLDAKIENDTLRACVIYDAYKEYCVRNSVKPKGLFMFSRALTKHISSGSLVSKRVTAGIVYIIDYKRVVSMLA